MTTEYAQQLEAQRARALALRLCGYGRLELVRVDHAGAPSIVSIIGATITPAVIDFWRRMGATVTTIETLGDKVESVRAAAPFPANACDCAPDCGRCIYPNCR